MSHGRAAARQLFESHLAPILIEMRRVYDTAARAAAPGCVAVLVVAIGGAVVLMYEGAWEQWDLRGLALIAAWIAAIVATYTLGMRPAVTPAAEFEAAVARMGPEVLQPLLAALRPGARYAANDEFRPGSLTAAGLFRDSVHAPARIGNHLSWRHRDLQLELFSVDAIGSTSGDHSSTVRVFRGLVAWAPLDGPEHDFRLHVRSRHEFGNDAGGPYDDAASPGTAIDDRYRVATNWAPFARAVLTPAVQARLRALAEGGTVVHAAVAGGRVWVALETEREGWFRGFPHWPTTLIETLDEAAVDELDEVLGVIEELAATLAAAVPRQPM